MSKTCSTWQAAPLARVQAALGRAVDTRVILDDIDTLFWRFRHIRGREVWMVNGPLVERFLPPPGPGVAGRFAWSKTVTDEQFAQGIAQGITYRERFKNHLADLPGNDGLLVMLTMLDIASLLTDGGEKKESYRNRSLQMLSISGLSGFPQISLPLGPAGSNLSQVMLGQKIASPAMPNQ